MTSSRPDGLCVFHMGYGKCASTLLQKQVFPTLDIPSAINPQESPFEGVGTPAARRRLVAQIFSCSPEIWEEQWVSDTLFGKTRPKFLISEETLFTRDGITSTRHITAHISTMRDIARARGYPRFKVLAIHRRQDERIASLYAQMSSQFVDARQAAFEDFVDAMCDPLRQRYRFGCRFDYGAQIRQLYDLLGRENVLFLPVELLESDAVGFLGRIFDFLELPNAQALASDRGAGLGSANVKRIGARNWQIQPLFDHLRPSLASRVKHLGATPKRGNSITLTDDLSRHMLSTFEESNRILDEHIADDLSSYGYFCSGTPRGHEQIGLI